MFVRTGRSLATQDLPPADFGCDMSHRNAWHAMVNNAEHEWFVVLEDDSPPLSRQAVSEFPPIPDICTFVHFSNASKFEQVRARRRVRVD